MNSKKTTITAQDVLDYFAQSNHDRDICLKKIAQSKGLPITGVLYLVEDHNYDFTYQEEDGNIVVEAKERRK